MILSPYRAVSEPGSGQYAFQPELAGKGCPVSRWKAERQIARATPPITVLLAGGWLWPQPPWPTAYTSMLCRGSEQGTASGDFPLGPVTIRHWRG